MRSMDPAPTTDTPVPAGADVAQLRELLRQNRFADMLTAARTVLATSPGQRDALLFAAIAQRYLVQIPEALKTLDALQQQYPRFSRLYEERGRCFVALRQAGPAIEAFLQAVHINHALPGSWGMLEGLYRMQGEAANAATAASQVATLHPLPQEVLVAI